METMSHAGRAAARRRLRARRRVRAVALLILAVALGMGAFAVLSPLLAGAEKASAVPSLVDQPPVAAALPAPRVEQVEASEAPCEAPEVVAALRDSDADALVAAFGGGESLRQAVLDGAAPCVRLDDPAMPWVVVNKLRPLDPIDYAPREVRRPAARVADVGLRADALAAFERLADAAAEGAGRIALYSGYRSYDTQVSTYAAQVGARGGGADALSARPGHSEHQLGLAADVVACGAWGCGDIYEVGGTAQGRWLAENAWRYGWIVRYEAGRGETTGYDAEPWHLRYVGRGIAEAYQAGGFHTLEEFFGLPAAPDYD
jgi:D-alanyl-D-alanine carboxypeptidase